MTKYQTKWLFQRINLTLTPILIILKFVNVVELVIGFIIIGIVVTGMTPAVLTNDPAKVQEAADQTTERLLNFTTDRIVEEVKALPFEIITDKLPP